MAKTVKLSVGTLRINLDKLKSIEAELGKRYVARVGVLGEKSRSRMSVTQTKKGTNVATDKQSDLTNADIGLVHEKGSYSRNIPRRSFLLMPLETNLDKFIGTFGGDIFKGMTQENIIVAYRKLGIAAEAVIQRAFATRGFGRWAPNKPATIRAKGSDAPLIDTAQLRKSVSSTVVTV